MDHKFHSSGNGGISQSAKNELTLKFGFKFTDLFDSCNLEKLSGTFNDHYKTENPEQYERFALYSSRKGEGYDEIEESDILINSARYLEQFLAEFFGIKNEIDNLIKENEYERVILNVKKDFIQRRVFKKFKPADLPKLNYENLNCSFNILRSVLFSDLDWDSDEERCTALVINDFLELEKDYKTLIDAVKTEFTLPESSKQKANDFRSRLLNSSEGKVFFENLNDKLKQDENRYNNEYIKNIFGILEAWAFSRYYDSKGKEEIIDWVLYKLPLDLNYFDLVHNKEIEPDSTDTIKGEENSLRKRDGFKLTDTRYNNRQVMGEVEYCVFCHERKKDTCSTGMFDKDGTVKKNPLGIKLNGCPLDEKISQAHFLKDEGRSLAGLTLIMIDNPMCPGTGHRICNDCMKACIFQKQEPVNIPQIETRVLTEVLELPYGFEIYSLLTRWNPLNVKRPYELTYNGRNVMIVGMGPAGYTLAQYLLNEGFGVVGVDALKIEPVHQRYTGYVDMNGKYIHPEPIRSFAAIRDELDKRIFLGFGGVSEYGITVRWDKNFLKVVYLTLARRKYFKIYDGVRFGGTIEIDDAWALGFDHIAIATGAGKPTIAKMKNNLIRGMRMASDFLMALQLTGAAKKDSVANLQLRLPAVVIGGGLTAIDTATEAAAYYPVQVEKFLERYEVIVKEFSEEKFWAMYDKEEKPIAEKFIEHGREIKAER